MQPSAPALYRPGAEVSTDVSTWIKIWAGLLGIVVIVAVIYLVAITQTLASINGNLSTAQQAVVDVGGETKTLPRQVDNINTSLKDIDDDVRPIQAGARQIEARLQSIRGKLVNVDRSLVDTSGVLRTVLGQVPDVRNTLAGAQSAGSEGTNLIWRQVGGSPGSLSGSSAVNPVLDFIRGDSQTAIRQLAETNDALLRVCNALDILPPAC